MTIVRMSKACPRCKKEKPIGEFHGNASSRDGKNAYCKPCHVARNLDYRQRHRDRVRQAAKESRLRNRTSPRHFVTGVWRMMGNRVHGDRYQHKIYLGLPLLERQAFVDWAVRNPGFLKLFEYWVGHGQKRKDVPSINRINPDDGYVPGNMNWLTLSLNSSQTRKNKRYAAVLAARGNGTLKMVG